jgi:hypothetical protein
MVDATENARPFWQSEGWKDGFFVGMLRMRMEEEKK